MKLPIINNPANKMKTDIDVLSSSVVLMVFGEHNS
jgi:hypothetical protein